MRFATLGLVAALSALGAAQNLLDRLPKCAQSCYANNQGDCNAIDIACICGNSTLISGLSCCVFESCNPEEQKTTIDFAGSLCGAQGIDVPDQAGCGAAGTPTPTPSADPSPAATSSSTAGAAVHTGIGLGLGLGMAGLLAAL